MSMEIMFRGMSASPAVEATARRWGARLDRIFDRIVRSSVVIELPHRHQRHGHAFDVRIEVTIPERTIVVTQENPDVYIAVADAFQAARRQLQEHVQARRSRMRCGVAMA